MVRPWGGDSRDRTCGIEYYASGRNLQIQGSESLSGIGGSRSARGGGLEGVVSGTHVYIASQGRGQLTLEAHGNVPKRHWNAAERLGPRLRQLLEKLVLDPLTRSVSG